jgi:hypothetical protein
MRSFKEFQENAISYAASLPPGVRADMKKGGKTQSPVSDVAGLAATGLAVKAGLGGPLSSGLSALSKSDMARNIIRNLRTRGLKQIRSGKQGSSKKFGTLDTDTP